MLSQAMHTFQSDQEYIQLLEHIIDNCWNGILVANQKGEYIYSNKRYKDVTGYNGSFITQITAKEMEEHILRDSYSATRLVLENKKEFVLEQTFKQDNRTVLCRGVPVFNDGHKEVQYVVSNLVSTSQLIQVQTEAGSTKRAKKIFFQKAREMSESVPPEDEIVFVSRAISKVIEQISMVAKTDVTVFLRGESGTGKELVAKRLHNESDRKGKPFIKLNCSAIPEALLESELFGYEAGTFTGGNSGGKKGLLEHAHRGTLLLDEIGDMPLPLQAKLLRVLQEKEFTKLGGHTPIKVDIRFVAATNYDTQELLDQKKMRLDLFYRLNTIPITIPPLRERREDIPLLITHTCEKLCKKYGVCKTFSQEAVEYLSGADYPGNVRQLQNFIERLLLLSPGDEIAKADAVQLMHNGKEHSPHQMGELHEHLTLDEMLEDYERQILRTYKEKYKSTYKMAERLGKNQSTIFRKLQRFGIAE